MNRIQIVTWINVVTFAFYVCALIIDSPKLLFCCASLCLLCLLDEVGILILKRKTLSKREKNECIEEIIGNILLIAAFIAQLFEDDFITRLFA